MKTVKPESKESSGPNPSPKKTTSKNDLNTKNDSNPKETTHTKKGRKGTTQNLANGPVPTETIITRQS
jgi:hypothetical protein